MKAYCKMIVAIYALYLIWLYAWMHEDDIKKGIKKTKKEFNLRFGKIHYEVVK